MYELTDERRSEIDRLFIYHPPSESQPARYTQIRDSAHDFAILIAQLTPQSREQSLAFTFLEQAVMWANAAIARRE